MQVTGRQMHSTISRDGRLTLSLDEVSHGDPGEGEILVRVEACPINPSDQTLLVGPADVSTFSDVSEAGRRAVSFTVPGARLPAFQGRFDLPLPVGIEGAGTVIAAGRGVSHLEGRRVAVFGDGMYADYKKAQARDVIVLPEGTSAVDGASLFVNPLTALGIVETARNEGHTAIVHTAAASNLGQMLQRICLADGIPVINVVRSQEQVDLLSGIGATRILNSTEVDFVERLTDEVAAVNATIVFDAVGGGDLGSTILQAIERAAMRRMGRYDRYGSNTFKQLYSYGFLDPSPTLLNRLGFGAEWSVSGWLLFHFLRKSSPETVSRLHQRVVNGMKTTFASHYTKEISLSDALSRDVIEAYYRKATGEKYLVTPPSG